MKKELSKFNYIIMALILISLTIATFIIAFAVATGNQSNEKLVSRNESVINNGDYEITSRLYSNTISQSGSKPDGSNDFDLDSILVNGDDYTPTGSTTTSTQSNDGTGLQILHGSTTNTNNTTTTTTTTNNNNNNNNTTTTTTPTEDDNKSKKALDLLLFEEGKDYYIDGYYDDAIKTLRKMIRLYPDSPYVDFAKIYIGKSLVGRGKLKNDRNDFLTANKLFLDMLNFLTDSSKQEEMIDFVIALADSNKQFGIPNKDIEKGLDDLKFETTITTEKAKRHIYILLGFLKLFKDDYKGALDSFGLSKSVDASKPIEDLAQIGLSRTYLARNNKDDIERAISIWIEEFFKKKDEKKSSPYYPDAVSLFKINTYNYAKKFFDKKEYDNAIKYYDLVDEYLEDTIEEEEARYFKAVAQFNIQKFEQSLESFDKVLSNKDITRDSYAIFYIGKVNATMGDLSTDKLEKVTKFEIALGNLIDFKEIYPNHPFTDDAKELINYLQSSLGSLMGENL